MLIVSKFHDYYDSAAGMGIDKTCVYKRSTEQVVKDRYSYRDSFENKKKKFELEKFTIWFCGKVYPGVKIEEKDTYPPYESNKMHYFYDADKLENFLKKNNLLKELKGIRSRYYSRRDFREDSDRKEYFDFNRETLRKIKKDYVRYRCPVMVIDESGIIKNPVLKNYGFAKVKDPYTAFQELYMYISGVLGSSGNPMIELTDKDKQEKRGFWKWSFRTMPGDGKKPRGKKK